MCIISKVDIAKNDYEKARIHFKLLVDSINHDCFNIDKSEYSYFIKDLVSKGLLVENTYNSFQSTIVDSIDPTVFAINYIKFVTI